MSIYSIIMIFYILCCSRVIVIILFTSAEFNLALGLLYPALIYCVWTQGETFTDVGLHLSRSCRHNTWFYFKEGIRSAASAGFCRAGFVLFLQTKGGNLGLTREKKNYWSKESFLCASYLWSLRWSGPDRPAQTEQRPLSACSFWIQSTTWLQSHTELWSVFVGAEKIILCVNESKSAAKSTHWDELTVNVTRMQTAADCHHLTWL